MASGTLIRNISNAFRFRLHWESTPNQTANSSTIVARLYYESIASHGVLGYNDSRAATILINGNASNFTYTRNIGANGSKLIGTKTYTIQHYSDGTMSTPVGFSVNFGTTWAGTYYGTINASETAVLDKIERNSTINGTPPSFYFGQEEPTITISRNNTSYKHKLKIDLYYSGEPHVNVYWSDFFNTSIQIKTTDFNLSETLKALQRNKQYFSQNMRYTLFTYDADGNQMGFQEISGALLSSPGARVSVDKTSYKIGEKVEIIPEVLGLLSENTGLFYSNLYIGPSSTPDASTAKDMIFLVGNGDPALLDLTPEKYQDLVGQRIYVHAIFFGKDTPDQLRSSISQSFVLENGRPPLFSGSGSSIQYKDISSAASITGNDQILVRGKSTMRVDLTTAPRATGQDGANIERYILSIGSRTYSYPRSSIPSYVDHPIPSNSGSSMTWTVVDDRGQENSVSKVVDVRDYSEPIISTQTARRTSPTTKIELKVSGSIASVAGTNRISSVKWGLTPTNLTNNMTITFSADMSGLYTAIASATIPEDATQAFYFQTTDSFGGKSSIRTVSASGIEPLMFIDKEKKAVGIGMYPSEGLRFESVGPVKIANLSVADYGGDTKISTTRSNIKFQNRVGFENGFSSNAGSLIAGTLTVRDIVEFESRTDSGQLIISPGSGISNYNSGINLVRGSVVSKIYNHYDGYLYFEYDNRNYLKFGANSDAVNEFKTYYGMNYDHDGAVNFRSASFTMNLSQQYNLSSGKQIALNAGSQEIRLKTATSLLRVHSTNNGIYARTADDGLYIAMYASDFVKSSKREVKKNIEAVNLGSFKDDIMTTPLYKYHYLNDEDTERLRLGFILDECPVDNIDLRGEGLDVAAQVATLWGALQEVILENEDMKARLLELEG